MSERCIIDAGPALTFFAVNQERLLTRVVGKLSAPESVETEVRRKAEQVSELGAAANVWGRMTPGWIEILSDDTTPELAQAVQRISQLPMMQTLKQSKDLGETMVVAHAVVKAESGLDATVIIDDQGGQQMAWLQAERLRRFREQGKPFGSITCIDTVDILRAAIERNHIESKADLQEVYRRLRPHSQSLLPIGHTGLLDPGLWIPQR